LHARPTGLARLTGLRIVRRKLLLLLRILSLLGILSLLRLPVGIAAIHRFGWVLRMRGRRL
jgi:hypothetical protein